MREKGKGVRVLGEGRKGEREDADPNGISLFSTELEHFKDLAKSQWRI